MLCCKCSIPRDSDSLEFCLCGFLTGLTWLTRHEDTADDLGSLPRSLGSQALVRSSSGSPRPDAAPSVTLCFVSDNYPTVSPFGGIGSYTRCAAQTLAARGHEVHVLVVRRKVRRQTLTDGSVQVHLRPARWLPLVGGSLPGLGESLCLAMALWGLQRRHRFDAVEFPNWEGLGLVAVWLGIAPSVVRLHTTTIESVEARRGVPTRAERFLVWAERTSARLADGTVTHSDSHAEKLARAYGLPPARIIPHGIPIPVASAAEETIPAAVLCVGFLNSRKGTETFLKAAASVVGRLPGTEFWLAGVDQGREYESRFRREYPDISEGSVRFLGFVDEAELDRLYNCCAIYASASVYESFGLTFVEAMARGKPTVGCRAGAVPEIVRDGETGLLVPAHDAEAFAEALCRLLAHPGLRSRLGEAGRARAHALYSAERMGEEIEKLFAEIARHGRRPPTPPQKA